MEVIRGKGKAVVQVQLGRKETREIIMTNHLPLQTTFY
jgi:hypothetical protein